MDCIILKTNIDDEQKFKAVNDKFKSISHLLEWTVDQDDVDNVLMVLVSRKTIEKDLIEILSSIGIHSEELT
jgi:hypothetical protein